MAINNDAAERMAKLRAEAEEGIKEFNELYQEEKLVAAMKVREEIEKKVAEYTKEARNLCFQECKETENPILEAVTRLTFNTIKIGEEKGRDGAPDVSKIEDIAKAIDLKGLHDFCGGIGADKNWIHHAMKMNFLLTAQKAKDLGIDPKEIHDSYAMSEIARDFDMGKNPTSNTNLLRTLQMVITSMLGDGYKATSHDVAFLVSVYSKKNRRALTVSVANHKNFRNYIAEICHRIVTNKRYDVDYKKKKEK